MKTMTLIPYQSIGTVRIGDSREIVRNSNPTFREFRKNKLSKNTTDDYRTFHVFYTISNCVEAVEIFKGMDIVLNGVTITSLSLSELIKHLSDSSMTQDSDSVNFPSYGLSVSVQGDTVESYLVYSRGYWD